LATGDITGSIHRRHRATEFKKFLTKLDTNVPADLEVPDQLAVHLICDNYAIHQHQSVRAWLAKHPRFHLRFTPTLFVVAQPGRTLVGD
jgi:hypothetical protein